MYIYICVCVCVCVWQLNCVLIFKLRTCAKLNCLKWNCF